jgi:hypothetical protein
MTKKVLANLAQTDPDAFQRHQNNAHDIENEFDHVRRWIVINNVWETLKPWLLLGLASDHHGLRDLENVGQIPAAPSAAVPDTLTPPARSWRATCGRFVTFPATCACRTAIGPTRLTPVTVASGNMFMTVRRASADDSACTVMSLPLPRTL